MSVRMYVGASQLAKSNFHQSVERCHLSVHLRNFLRCCFFSVYSFIYFPPSLASVHRLFFFSLSVHFFSPLFPPLFLLLFYTGCRKTVPTCLPLLRIFCFTSISCFFFVYLEENEGKQESMSHAYCNLHSKMLTMLKCQERSHPHPTTSSHSSVSLLVCFPQCCQMWIQIRNQQRRGFNKYTM